MTDKAANKETVIETIINDKYSRQNLADKIFKQTLKTDKTKFTDHYQHALSWISHYKALIGNMALIGFE